MYNRFSMSVIYDVIVIGGGVEGSASAYSLAKDGYKTLLLDKYPLPHSRGSSHGHSRITRKAYNKQYYANMMPTAFSLWEQLEKAEGVQIYEPCGLLSLAAPDQDNVLQTIRDSLRGISAPFEDLDNETIKRKYPMFRLDSTFQAVLDPSGGILLADKAMAAYWSQFRKSGGELRDNEEVTQIIPGDIVTVITRKGQYRSKSIIICAGPWTSKLVSPVGLHLPLQPVRIGVYYWRDLLNQFSLDKGMPCVIFLGNIGDVKYDVYGLPSVEYPGHFKLCSHGGLPIDPDERDSAEALAGNEKTVDAMKQVVENMCVGLDPHPTIQEACMYTNTPDGDFILDSHPHWKNIVVGAGFSGHGFKLSPVVGKLLSELATQRLPSFDVKPFRIDRFFQSGPTSKI